MKDRYKKLTLFAVICVLSVLAMLYFLIAERNSPGEVRYAILVLMLPVLLGMVAIDVVLRYLVKKLYWIWIIEAVLLLTTIYFWIVIE